MSTIQLSAGLLPSDKVQTRHRDRQAVVNVRQSTMRQVQQNQKSTRLQYALADRARQLGWEQEQVIVIDDDLGPRQGFVRDPHTCAANVLKTTAF